VSEASRSAQPEGSAPARGNDAARLAPAPLDRIESTAQTGDAPGASDALETIEAPIYSARDAGVVPPRLDPVQSISPAPVEENPGEPILVEIVVSEDGTVDSVKSTALPDTLGQSIWMTNSLSAVKTWKFQPALKDGRPVKYRFFLPLGGN
jgi:hypothetical protein